MIIHCGTHHKNGTHGPLAWIWIHLSLSLSCRGSLLVKRCRCSTQTHFFVVVLSVCVLLHKRPWEFLLKSTTVLDVFCTNNQVSSFSLDRNRTDLFKSFEEPSKLSHGAFMTFPVVFVNLIYSIVCMKKIRKKFLFVCLNCIVLNPPSRLD